MGKSSLLTRSGSENTGRYLCRRWTDSLDMEVCTPIPLLQELESTNKPAPSPKTPDGIIVRTPSSSIASLDQAWCGGLSLTWNASLPWLQFTKLLQINQNQRKLSKSRVLLGRLYNVLTCYRTANLIVRHTHSAFK